jgi:hypothetical protein
MQIAVAVIDLFRRPSTIYICRIQVEEFARRFMDMVDETIG